MEYLGWCMLMGSVWMIGESKMRQILVPNASGLATSCFIMLMLCPLPISLYVNNLQKGKYKKIFQPICFIALLNFIICTILHLTGVADYIETMPAKTRNPYYYFPCCHSYFLDQILESSESKWLPVVLWTAYYNAFCDFWSNFCILQSICFWYICRYRYFDLTVYKCDLYDPYHPWYHQTPARGRTR